MVPAIGLYLTTLGFSCPFSYYAIPVTKQAEEGLCMQIACCWVRQTVRDHLGREKFPEGTRLNPKRKSHHPQRAEGPAEDPEPSSEFETGPECRETGMPARESSDRS